MSNYTQFFDFQTRPFDPCGNRSPVLGTESLQKTFEEIQTALAKDVPVIFLQGPPGVGKSSLARALPKLLASERRAFVMKSPGLEDLDEALRVSALSEPSDESRPSAPTFIFDDADAVSAEFLEKLSSVLADWTESPGLSCLMIRTTHSSRDPLESGVPAALDGLVSEEIPLEPLSSNGTQRYIEKHLQRAGGSSEELFPQEVMRAVHMRAEGVPREISRLCEGLLKRAARTQTKTIDPEWLEDTTPKPPPRATMSEVAVPWSSTASAVERGVEETLESSIKGKRTGVSDSQKGTDPEWTHESSPTETELPRKRRRLAFRFGFSALILLLAAVSSFLLDPLGQRMNEPLEPQPQEKGPASFSSPQDRGPTTGTDAKKLAPIPATSTPHRPIDSHEKIPAQSLGPFAWSPPERVALLPPINAEAPALWLDNQKLLLQIKASAAHSSRRAPGSLPEQVRPDPSSTPVKAESEISLKSHPSPSKPPEGLPQNGAHSNDLL
ncbi:MAG: AAA family ATPase [Myxococcota bacterium]|nr:AAA family ATPase [Myxococcota bacterium]